MEERGDIKQPASTVSTAPRSPYAKIVTENERLRKELKKVRNQYKSTADFKILSFSKIFDGFQNFVRRKLSEMRSYSYL